MCVYAQHLPPSLNRLRSGNTGRWIIECQRSKQRNETNIADSAHPHIPTSAYKYTYDYNNNNNVT